MSVIKAAGAGEVSTGFFDYELNQSLRFEDGDSAQLSRTPSSAGNQKTWTWSSWVKRSTLGATQTIFCGGTGSTLSVDIAFNSSDNIIMLDTNNTYLFITTAVFRDTSAWYHIVIENDTTQASVINRTKLYVNGEQITDFSTDNRSNFSQNEDTGINSTNIHYIGRWINGGQQFDGYMAEINFIDGTALDADNFGETKDGVWVPKEYTGSYGTNGFYLPFSVTSGFSAMFDGTGDNIQWSSASAFDIGSSDDFCLEMFVKGDFESNYSYGFGDGAFMMQLGNNGNFYGYTSLSTSNGFDASSYLTTTNWHHVAWVRESGTYRFYIDGVQRHSATSGGTNAFDVSSFNVGDATPSAGAPHYDGHVSNLRFTIGAARYGSGTTFTVPSSTLTNDSSNVKLLAFTTATITADGSSGALSGSITEGDPILSSNNPFSNAIGNDESGNNNDYTPSSNLDFVDVVPDRPTNNWCTNNATMRANITHSEGNLKMVGVGTNFDNMAGTFLFDVEDADGWYWEGYVNSGSTEVRFGISKPENIYFNQSDPTYNYSHSSDGYSYKGAGQKSNGASANVTYGDSFTTGDVIGIAVKAGALYFYKNGTIQNSGTAAYTGLTGQYVPAFSLNGTTSVIANYGQDSTFAGTISAGGNSDANGLGDFKYSVPSGYKALCASNLPDITIGPGETKQADDFFETMLYTGSGGEQHIGAGGVQHPQDTITIANSVRFEDGDNNYLSKSDQGTSSSNKQFTFSCWVKRGNVGSYSTILGTPEGGDREYFGFIDTNEFIYQVNNGTNLISNRKFLNTSGWYHVVVAVNINESTASDRQKIYINGEQITSFSSANYYGSSDTVQFMKSGAATFIGRLNTTNVNSFDGYMAEINFIDGSTLDPTYFGQVGSNGYWIPKALSGLTYGTNGFRLDFADSSALGDDESGRTNDFTVSGLAATDHSIDSPTQNFATIDTEEYGVISSSATTSQGNTAVTVAGFSSTLWGGGFSTFEVPYGFKAYVEVRANAAGSLWGAGVCLKDSTPSSTNTGGSGSVTYYNRSVMKNGVEHQYHSDDGLGGNGDGTNPLASGDILSIAVDGSTGDVWFADNGTYFKPIISHNTSGAIGSSAGDPAAGTGATGTVDRGDDHKAPLQIVLFGGSSTVVQANFGANPSFNDSGFTAGTESDDNGVGLFKYNPPTGFLALMDDNLPKEGIESPDWVWIKSRSLAVDHVLHDSVRGLGSGGVAFNTLQSSASDAEINQTDGDGLLSLDNQGFTVGYNNSNAWNADGATYVAWTWKAGGAPTADNSAGVGATPTAGSVKIDGSDLGSALAGSIAATRISASTTAGFSIVAYTGAGTGTVAHGLGITPSMYIVKCRSNSATNWRVYHKGIASDAETDYLTLDSTLAAGDATFWNDTAPTSSVFSVFNYDDTGTSSRTYVAYVFADVEGFSKAGAYTGNGNANGTFVYTGFRPAWVLCRRSSSTAGWHIFDNKRPNAYNDIDQRLEADNSDAENTTSGLSLDFLSNGFKFRGTFDNINGSGATHIYLAFAEAPFKFANAR